MHIIDHISGEEIDFDQRSDCFFLVKPHSNGQSVFITPITSEELNYIRLRGAFLSGDTSRIGLLPVTEKTKTRYLDMKKSDEDQGITVDLATLADLATLDTPYVASSFPSQHPFFIHLSWNKEIMALSILLERHKFTAFTKRLAANTAHQTPHLPTLFNYMSAFYPQNIASHRPTSKQFQVHLLHHVAYHMPQQTTLPLLGLTSDAIHQLCQHNASLVSFLLRKLIIEFSNTPKTLDQCITFAYLHAITDNHLSSLKLTHNNSWEPFFNAFPVDTLMDILTHHIRCYNVSHIAPLLAYLNTKDSTFSAFDFLLEQNLPIVQSMQEHIKQLLTMTDHPKTPRLKQHINIMIAYLENLFYTAPEIEHIETRARQALEILRSHTDDLFTIEQHSPLIFTCITDEDFIHLCVHWLTTVQKEVYHTPPELLSPQPTLNDLLHQLEQEGIRYERAVQDAIVRYKTYIANDIAAPAVHQEGYATLLQSLIFLLHTAHSLSPRQQQREISRCIHLITSPTLFPREALTTTLKPFITALACGIAADVFFSYCGVLPLTLGLFTSFAALFSFFNLQNRQKTAIKKLKHLITLEQPTLQDRALFYNSVILPPFTTSLFMTLFLTIQLTSRFTSSIGPNLFFSLFSIIPNLGAHVYHTVFKLCPEIDKNKNNQYAGISLLNRMEEEFLKSSSPDNAV